MNNTVFKPQEVVVVRNVWTFTESILVRDIDSSVGYVIPDDVEDAFYENGYKIRVNRAKGKIEVYAYRHSLSATGDDASDATIYLADGESVELRGYGDIRKIKL